MFSLERFRQEDLVQLSKDLADLRDDSPSYRVCPTLGYAREHDLDDSPRMRDARADAIGRTRPDQPHSCAPASGRIDTTSRVPYANPRGDATESRMKRSTMSTLPLPAQSIDGHSYEATCKMWGFPTKNVDTLS